MASLKEQANWSKETMGFLNDLNSELRSTSNKYLDMVYDLRQNGYFIELLPQIERSSEEFEFVINNTIKHIEDVHLDYIYKQLKK